MSCQQFVDFFTTYCGTIVQDSLEGISETEYSPVCHPSKLAEKCVERRLQDGSRWGPDLYAVNNFFIKPLTLAKSCSYAELLNPKGRDIVFFITHHWGEEFAEFVQSLMLHAIMQLPGFGKETKFVQTTYWCCAFALNQHAIQLGEKIEDNPFHKAIMSDKCHGIILNVNQTVTALFRVWCTYEVLLVRNLGKSVTICTKNGPLGEGSGRSMKRDQWVSHMNRMLQLFDIREARSTEPEDRRKIMAEVNSFVGKGVAQGLMGSDALNVEVKAILAGQAIFTLIRKGDIEGVRSAIELKADVNAPDPRGVRPLTYAAGYNMTLGQDHIRHEEVIKLLEDSKADPKAKAHADKVIMMWDHNNRKRAKALRELRVIRVEDEEKCKRGPLGMIKENTQESEGLASESDEEDEHEVGVFAFHDASYNSAVENHRNIHERLIKGEDPESEIYTDTMMMDFMNLCYAPTKLHTNKAERVVDELCASDDMQPILRDALLTEGAKNLDPAEDPNQKVLLMCLSDFEPDDIMAIAQLWELHKPQESGGHNGPPIVCFLPNARKDTTKIFELKNLVAALTLGITRFGVLVPKEASAKAGDKISPKIYQYEKARDEEINRMCDRLADFRGDQIIIYLMGPCNGALHDIIARLQERRQWPLQAKWRVRLYSGSYNMRGMTEDDLKSLHDIIDCSKPGDTMLDMAKYVFFGKDRSHACTANFTTFAPKDFASELNINAPLLGAALKLNSKLFHTKLIEPSPWLFRCKAEYSERLTPEECHRFEAIREGYSYTDYEAVVKYAQDIFQDKPLFAKMAHHKKSTLFAMANDADDAPLCDQLLFLYEWHTHRKRRGVFREDRGKWTRTAQGFTSIDTCATQEDAASATARGEPFIWAVQPYMEDPFDEDSLDRMREKLQKYLLLHLCELYDPSASLKTRRASMKWNDRRRLSSQLVAGVVNRRGSD